MATTDLTAQRLRELLHYDPETGVFTRVARSGWKVKIGDIAGCRRRDGYVEISVLGKQKLAHRLAWLFVTGHWPVGQIDHINGNTSDNRFSNLRQVTPTGNSQNQRRPNSRGTSGFLGVSKRSDRPGWRATINIDGKYTLIGTFATPELAHAAYLEKKRQHHPTCTI